VVCRAISPADEARSSKKDLNMTRNLSLIMALGAISITPAMATAAPGGNSGSHGGGGAMHGPTSTAPVLPSSPTGNGGGYSHSNTPQHTTGQPMQSCETTGSPPGGSGSAPGSAFSGGTADEKYAGSQPQNSRNTASVSQYDVACANQPH
jgi:hypothetical protein